MKYQNKKERSEGEQFISEYFEDERIRYIPEKKLNTLKNDSKTYRKADFYLPHYKMYVEFYGQWNQSKEANRRYREKKKIYKLNNIPCVYLYPENLGIIDYSFTKRMVKELKNKNMLNQLFKFRLRILIMDRGGLFLWLFLALFILVFGDNQWEDDKNTIFILAAVVAYQLYRLFDGYLKFFKWK